MGAILVRSIQMSSQEAKEKKLTSEQGEKR